MIYIDNKKEVQYAIQMDLARFESALEPKIKTVTYAIVHVEYKTSMLKGDYRDKKETQCYFASTREVLINQPTPNVRKGRGPGCPTFPDPSL